MLYLPWHWSHVFCIFSVNLWVLATCREITYNFFTFKSPTKKILFLGVFWLLRNGPYTLYLSILKILVTAPVLTCWFDNKGISCFFSDTYRGNHTVTCNILQHLESILKNSIYKPNDENLTESIKKVGGRGFCFWSFVSFRVIRMLVKHPSPFLRTSSKNLQHWH